MSDVFDQVATKRAPLKQQMAAAAGQGGAGQGDIFDQVAPTPQITSNAGLAPPASPVDFIGKHMEGSVFGRSDAGPENLPPGKIPRSILDKPADWKDDVIGGGTLAGGAILAGEPVAAAAVPAVKAGARFVRAHPGWTMAGIEAAKQLPGAAGRIAGHIPSWLPLLAGKGEPEPEGAAPPPVRWNPEMETTPQGTAAPPVRWNPQAEPEPQGATAPPIRWNPQAEPEPQGATAPPIRWNSPRLIDQMGGQPVESITQPSGDSLLDRIRGYASNIEAQGHGEETAPPEETTPQTTNLNEDLTPALKTSLRKVRLAKAARSVKPN